jgi:AmmeMemoRadiSam system protein A
MNELIKLARDSIAAEFGEKINLPNTIKEKYSDKVGVFVTLTHEGELRGCIGYIESEKPLWESIIECAKFAAFDDDRFYPVTEEEFEDLDIEISILTKPKLVLEKDPEKLKKLIVIGKHGLIIKKGWKNGVLLPQVASEYNWDPEMFLKQVCIKAGLSPNTWKETSDYELKMFEAKLIHEE